MSSTSSATVASHSQDTCLTDVDTFDDSKVDIRRYATLLPAQIAEGLSLVYFDEEDDDDSYTDSESTWEFSPEPVACAVDYSKPSDATTYQAHHLVKKYQECPKGATEAQKVIQDYLQRHAKSATQETAEARCPNTAKELPIIPYNRDSTYTLAITDDGRSMIDLEKRPEPAIRMFHHDREGVAQAQLQGIEMIQAGRCTPGGGIRCQRPGCTDVLRDLEALKCHLHIHNIGDMSDATSTSSTHTQKAKEPAQSSIESPPTKKTSRKVHNRSKSFADLDATSGHSWGTHSTRKNHARSPYSPPRSRKPSDTHVNSGVSRARTKLPDTLNPQPRGRRSNRGTVRGGLSEIGHNDSIAMVLSRPTSPVQGTKEALGFEMNLPLNFVNKSRVLSAPASPTRGEKEVSRAKSPNRAFSPVRALSPIRGMSNTCVLSDLPVDILMSRRSPPTGAFVRMFE
ncbi:uncharacterized protein EDB91DRAFT_1340467 [Suillus paluster]|uniref:uncharacterized protein n=1 Tax=Suillus paluster TaxID=48578 RepID=UPI001B869D2D|nr:uncharacterized protein EDB91DRAFT_1340467 [Suillus paluster]KAG1722040.1 hypothetical protein EDB91DRAFT_1340467 [Suillus paluster]